MKSLPSSEIQDIIFQSIELTDDGIGIFDANDILIFCNDGIAKLFGCSRDVALNKSFDELVRHCYNSNYGIKIDSDDIDEWLTYAKRQRRSKPFRTFETDMQNGQWFLVTEQVVNNDYIYIYITDITEKKKALREIELLSKKFQTLASTDSLTGINNRRQFFSLSESEFNRCQREQKDLSLLTLDIDYFKEINDKIGHHNGDLMLTAFAQNITTLLRAYDTFGRLGGEEFAILLPSTNYQEALDVTERIRRSIEEMIVDLNGTPTQITTSIGVISKSTQTKSVTELVKLADQKLYMAKAEGRNIVC